MRRRTTIALFVIVIVVAGAAAAQQAGFIRTPLADNELSITDRHGVMARVEIDAGVASGRHTHPGEEFAYVVEGTFQVTIDGKAPTILKGGEVFFIPANTIHEGRNVGTTKARVISTYIVEKGKPLSTPAK